MARFAIGGFQHETNTFAPVKASFRDFEMADGWPGLTRGDAMLTAFEGINLPIAGFLAQARKQGHDAAADAVVLRLAVGRGRDRRL